MGTKTLAISKAAPKSSLYESVDKRQTEQLSCRRQRAVGIYVFPARKSDGRSRRHIEWVQEMNNIRNSVTEIVNSELIYTQ